MQNWRRFYNNWKFGAILKTMYWICFVLLVLVGASLLVGTLRSPTPSDIESLVESNKVLSDRVDKLITVLEAQNERINR